MTAILPYTPGLFPLYYDNCGFETDKTNGMKHSTTVTWQSILRALDEVGRSAGAGVLSERLAASGLSPRTVRYHLLQMDREGLTRFVSRRQGREITDRGRRELARVEVVRKVGVISARIEMLGFAMDFTVATGTGTVITNVGMIHKSQLLRAMEDMKHVFIRRLGMGGRIAIIREGESIAGITVPRDQMAIGTVSSVSIDGILLRSGVPVRARFGGLLEIRDSQPMRFVDLIEYGGTSLDPLELFIKAGRTSVRTCARGGTGTVVASFREFPALALDRVLKAGSDMERHSLGGIIALGRPGQPVLDIPVAEDRVGMVVIAGLNPIAALHEAGAPVSIVSMAGLADYGIFHSFQEWRDRYPR